jgi:predicted membrane channel-forming protein YqfA (hemolysin III family)
VGWLGVAAVVLLFEALGLEGLAWLGLGGLLYSAGVVF